MLVDSITMLGSSNDVLTAAAGAHEERGKVGGFESNSGEEDKGRVVDDGDQSLGGNRWPRLETLALLKIRSDMDSVFRDSNLKAPLWEDVSRKLGERGYNRSAKKCKEKFENVYKYHRRTKGGRSGKHDGKTYRFFEQLEALENHHHHLNHPAQVIQPQKPQILIPEASSMAAISTVPSVPTTNPKINITSSQNAPTNPQIHSNVYANLFSNSISSSTASDEEFEGRRGRKKRKWKDFFGRMTKEVIRKQEELQKKLLEAIEQHEHERKIREEAWRLQEMARIYREHEILLQERSLAAAKDAAVIAFLQKISDQQIPPPPPPAVHCNPLAQPLPPQPPKHVLKLDNGENFVSAASPSRWPKAEVEALIRIRTNLDIKYQDNGPKGPLWEEISAAMAKIGCNRSSKRCKEKWENINKYFKKVKESSKKRPEDSKTCPYFHQLNALYEEKKSKMEPLMVLPEQQWPPPLPQPENQKVSLMEDIDHKKVNMEQNLEEEGDSEEEEEDEDEGGSYEIVTNKMSSMGSG